MAFMPAKIIPTSSAGSVTTMPKRKRDYSLNQQFSFTGHHDCRAVSLPVEDRVVFQMIKTASAD